VRAHHGSLSLLTPCSRRTIYREQVLASEASASTAYLPSHPHADGLHRGAARLPGIEVPPPVEGRVLEEILG
jgi:hypothetical protein